MKPITKIASYTLVIVVAFLLINFFFGPGEAFATVKDVFSNVKDTVNLSIGIDEIKGDKPELPSKHKEAIGLLKTAIKEMRGKEECFKDYRGTLLGSDQGRNGLPELGEEGTSIILQKSGDDMLIILLGGVSGQQEISRETFSNVNPCVISGENIAARFQSKIIEKLNPQATNYYNPVDSIIIKFDSTLIDYSENRISYNNGPALDFEDGGFLFTPDGKNICFFPTSDFSTNDEGLDDDILGNADEDSKSSIKNLLAAGELNKC